MTLLILCAMIFIHCFIDFCTQRILADLKQKEWWEKNYPDELYKNDYKVALAIHSFMWSFGIMIPIFWFADLEALNYLLGVLILNTIIHAIIDDKKANKHQINLLWDQLYHLVQIVVTWIVWCIMTIYLRK